MSFHLMGKDGWQHPLYLCDTNLHCKWPENIHQFSNFCSPTSWAPQTSVKITCVLALNERAYLLSLLWDELPTCKHWKDVRRYFASNTATSLKSYKSSSQTIWVPSGVWITLQSCSCWEMYICQEPKRVDSRQLSSAKEDVEWKEWTANLGQIAQVEKSWEF
jgi:hypothetical protein